MRMNDYVPAAQCLKCLVPGMPNTWIVCTQGTDFVFVARETCRDTAEQVSPCIHAPVLPMPRKHATHASHPCALYPLFCSQFYFSSLYGLVHILALLAACNKIYGLDGTVVQFVFVV